MSLALLVVTAVRIEGRSKAEVARDYGVSWRWVHELVKRYDAEGEAGLAPRSRKPRSSPGRTPDDVEEQIVAMRKDLADQGLDAGAHTIAYHLEKRGVDPPAVSTIWRILVRRGFVTPQPQKRPKSSYLRFEAEMPNERWQADITHVPLADDSQVEVLNVIDDHSRLLLASDALRIFKAADVVVTFHKAAAAHGFPATLLTDNGAVFTAISRGGLVALEIELAALGVAFRHSRPYHPQTCGKIERFHQTLKRWLDKQPRARTVKGLQAQLDSFRDYYNQVRPHRAIGRRTPIEAFEARPKATPALPPLIAPTPFRVRKDRIDRMGKLTIRHNSKLHHIGIGRAFAGTRVILLVDGLRVRVVSEDGELLRELTIDPIRDYQPRD